MISIRNLENSFVRFGETVADVCLFEGLTDTVLPVFDQEDIYFQFLIEAETIEEADALCGITNEIEIGIVKNCEQDEFTLAFSEKPARYRVGPLQVLYNWEHGLPGFAGAIDIGECLRIRVKLGDLEECSNTFQRIAEPCFTSVLEFGNQENAFGFLYCADASTLVEGDTTGCEPLALGFINKSLIAIPYTEALRAKYGDTPSVQVWHIVNGKPQVVIVEVTLDDFPPTLINVDNGGPATGWIVIR